MNLTSAAAGGSRDCHFSPLAAESGSDHEWRAELAEALAPLVRVPRRFERFEDRGVPAVKVIGFDAAGERCFYRHHYVCHDERIDEEDWPIVVESFREQVSAWRLADGRWLRLAVRVSGFPGCGRRIERDLAIVDRPEDAPR